MRVKTARMRDDPCPPANDDWNPNEGWNPRVKESRKPAKSRRKENPTQPAGPEELAEGYYESLLGGHLNGRY